MKVGDLVRKEKGNHKGRIGVITRVEKYNEGHVILEVLASGNVFQWAETWCTRLEVEVINESR
jgi:hypothetical protein